MIEEPRFECYKCEEELVFEVKISRLDTCPNCEAYLHSCRSCQFWSPSAHNQCVENQGEFIRDRQAGNFCGHFQFRRVGEDTTAEADAARSKLDSVFGGGGATDKPKLAWGASGSSNSEEAARARLDSLFKK